MKATIFLAAFLLYTACAFASSINKKCPTDYTIETLLPHKKCNQYYHCVLGVALERVCRSGLYFNVKTWQCDFPDNVDCGDRETSKEEGCTCPNSSSSSSSSSSSESESEEVPGVGECPQDWTQEKLLPHKNCNQFYKCSRGVPVAMHCPAGLYYNPARLYCDWPYNVDCRDRHVPKKIANEKVYSTTKSTPVKGQDPRCPSDWAEDRLLPHENCNQFYQCSRGVPVEMSCQSGLVYNPQNWQCEWPNKVDCSGRN